MPKMRKSFLRAGYAVAAGTFAAFLTAGTAQASFIATIQQQGANVVANGSGTLDLTGLTFAGTEVETTVIDPPWSRVVFQL